MDGLVTFFLKTKRGKFALTVSLCVWIILSLSWLSIVANSRAEFSELCTFDCANSAYIIRLIGQYYLDLGFDVFSERSCYGFQFEGFSLNCRLSRVVGYLVFTVFAPLVLLLLSRAIDWIFFRN